MKSGDRPRLRSPRSPILSVWSKNALHPGEVFNADFLQRREICGCLGGRTKIASLIALNPAKRCQILKLRGGLFLLAARCNRLILNNPRLEGEGL